MHKCAASITEELFGSEHIEFGWQVVAMGALHEGSEAYIGGLFENSNLASIHMKQQTLMVQDIHLVHCICGDDKEVNESKVDFAIPLHNECLISLMLNRFLVMVDFP